MRSAKNRTQVNGLTSFRRYDENKKRPKDSDRLLLY
jgi:hypothetical protein